MHVHQIRNTLLSAAAVFALALAVPGHAPAQVSFGVNIGDAPMCPYGYYGYYPYNCAPYGYYGPEWFNSGTFIGAGPWYRGEPGYYGHVDNRFDPRYGYRGGFPEHGGYREPGDHWRNFHGNDFHGVYGEGHAEGFRNGGFHGHGGGDHGGHH